MLVYLKINRNLIFRFVINNLYPEGWFSLNLFNRKDQELLYINYEKKNFKCISRKYFSAVSKERIKQ